MSNEVINNLKAQSSSTKIVDSEQHLTQSITALPCEMQPERDLWSGIERAIHNMPQQPATNIENVSAFKKFTSAVPMAWAASLVLAVMVSWFTFAPSMLTQPNEQIAHRGAVTEDLVQYMEQNFIQQKQAMQVSFRQPNLTNLPIEMQNELTKLAEARKTISKALLADKHNVDLLNLLDFTQQQELKLLEQLYRQYQVI
ncbi:hypothetical protein KO495_09730 [Colwellia sp. D2M02]|uniref:hypothetical protein n=1 Tax=Colwellia sp. D2M02 TaxID=2841562 RepID=UPI001C09D1BD|nr:hypothetical protein [Colwellia sp. D2M02]MBU2893598.1 hypothetical protein [Colwellia sp. D2M02]